MFTINLKLQNKEIYKSKKEESVIFECHFKLRKLSIYFIKYLLYSIYFPLKLETFLLLS